MKLGVKFTILGAIFAFFALISMWIIPVIFNGNKTPTMKQSNIAFFQKNVYNFREIDELDRKEIEDAKSSNIPFSNRPKVEIINPLVSFTNWENGSIVYGEPVESCVTAGFDIKFVNIGEVDALNLATKWMIFDDNRRITGLNEWRTKYQKQRPLVIKKLSSNSKEIVSIKYGPHIGADGEGMLKLILDYEYIDAKTGERYRDKYKGFIEYKTVKNSQSKSYLFSPYT